MGERLAEAATAVDALASDAELSARITAAGRAMVNAYAGGDKAIFMGNGGSAAEATHLAAELVGRYLVDRSSSARAGACRQQFERDGYCK